jgi:hypothetical protein
MLADSIDLLELGLGSVAEDIQFIYNDCLQPMGDPMHTRSRLTDAELAVIRRRWPGVRASLACEGMYLTSEDEALFEQMDRERMPANERVRRVLEISRAERREKTPA